MSERPSFWQRLFGRAGSSSLSARQQKVSDYILARMESDVPLQEVLREDYVRRNCSQAEVERIVSDPEFIETARQRLGESFRSEEFRLQERDQLRRTSLPRIPVNRGREKNLVSPTNLVLFCPMLDAPLLVGRVVPLATSVPLRYGFGVARKTAVRNPSGAVGSSNCATNASWPESLRPSSQKTRF
jgi:hypothetical protein